MPDNVAIKVENLSKAYRIGLKEEIPDTFLGAATGWLKAPLRNLRRLRRLNTFDSNPKSEIKRIHSGLTSSSGPSTLFRLSTLDPDT